MAVGRGFRFELIAVAAVWSASCSGALAQAPEVGSPVVAAQPQAGEQRPLPNVAELMHEVEKNQRTSEVVLRDYLYHEVATKQDFDGHGGVKKTESVEFDVFWLNGVQVHKMLKKDGKDLTPEEQKKEDERIDKEVAKAKERRSKADAKGEETDSHGHEEVTVSRLLTLGTFSDPRRVQLNGRDTIAVDFVGNPKAKTQNRAEEVIRDLAGTAWIDEQDKTLARVEGKFANSFKVGGGLVANVKQGTTFSFQQKKVNGEVWLPVEAQGQGEMRVLLLVGFNGKVRMVTSDYRKFKATATILPGMSTVEQQGSDAPQ